MLSLFARPDWLWLLLAVPLGAAVVVRAQTRRRRAWQTLGQSGVARGTGAWAWLVASLLLVVALAQPRWGLDPAHALPAGQDVTLLVDVSRSMGAEDAVPNRLGVAVESAQSLVRALGSAPGTRAALVAFSGRGVVRAPLTENLGAVDDALQRLRPGDVQPGGTDLGAALLVALDCFDDQERAEGRSIVVFSDGEDHAERWGAVLPRLRELGAVVHAVAIGDAAEGHLVPSGRDDEPLVYQGEPVRSRREDSALGALASATGGAFVPLGLKTADLEGLYRGRIESVARRRHELAHPGQRTERFQWAVGVALAVGLLGSWPRQGRPWRKRRWAALGAAGVLFIEAAAGDPGPAGGSDPAAAVARGRVHYTARRYEAALKAFEQARQLDSASAVPPYDAASALFQLGRYREALAQYAQARARAAPALRTKIDYALGNTALRLGLVSEAVDFYDACLASRVEGPAYDAVRSDAAINRRFAVELAKRPPREPGEGPLAPRPPRQQGGGSPNEQEEPKNAPEAQPEPQGGAPGAPREGERNAKSANPKADAQTKGVADGPGSLGPEEGSPEARLAAALKNIREARQHRLADAELPPPAAESNRKDW